MDASVEKMPESALSERLATPLAFNAETSSFTDRRANPASREGGNDWGRHLGALPTPLVHQQTHPLPARPNFLPPAANARFKVKKQSSAEGSQPAEKRQKTLAGMLGRRVQEKLTARRPRHRGWRAQACSQEEYQAWKRLGQKRLIDAYDWEDNVVVLLHGEEVDGGNPEQDLDILQWC
ncbi:MAG: hypothetical protein Q9208_003353 [Pyrenodesmia sp. 3 TL-2023]